MAKVRRIERRKTATREISIHLGGWPGERRLLSVVDEYWYVELEVKLPTGNTMTKKLFDSSNYIEALDKYNMYLPLVS
jgi:hypothetical protein